MILTGRYSLLGPENQRFYWNQPFNIFQLNPGKVGTNTLIIVAPKKSEPKSCQVGAVGFPQKLR